MGGAKLSGPSSGLPWPIVLVILLGLRVQLKPDVDEQQGSVVGCRFGAQLVEPVVEGCRLLEFEQLFSLFFQNRQDPRMRILSETNIHKPSIPSPMKHHHMCYQTKIR